LEPLEIAIGNYLRHWGLKLALAESCTGGLVADRITNQPGSSDYFMGGIVAYSYEAKVSLLGVSWDTLHQHGAVSRETVIEMARGARKVFDADIAVSVSGIAGPGGGLPGKPVGTVWIGLSAADGDRAWCFYFQGNRLRNKRSAARQSLKLVIAWCQGTLPPETEGDF